MSPTFISVLNCRTKLSVLNWSIIFLLYQRVSWKLFELAVLDTQLDELLMSFFSDLVFLLLKFWMEGKILDSLLIQ